MARSHRAAWTVIADEALRLRAYGRRSNHNRGMRSMMVEAADRALSQADEEEKNVYRLRYVNGMNHQMASDTMHVSTRTYYRILNRLIQRVENEIA